MDRAPNKRWRWKLSTMLFIVVPICAGLVYGATETWRVKGATDAWGLMTSKAVVSQQPALVDGVISFRPGAVTDADLMAFIPACKGPLPNGLGTIRALELNGSKVSDEAIARFNAAAPHCEIRR